ncbi:zinc finger protein 845 [Drosophila mojavensis]|uniref:C2H2-type domain-containing protein n=1 Tax=Drosophila mojavensis TaxID=7230 RepID=B4KAQ4_DROMO|nr:zinc finger protein 845 [Drosophila mojavensis]EDW16791.2 uncharacterized protein Dmoj_GI22033 [Drosophila mojavensis]
MSRCPRCNCVASGQNRLVTDSCGHNKCRLCLLADEVACSECQLTRELEPAADAVGQPVENVDYKHITSTTQGYHCSVCNKSFRSRTQQYYHRSCGNEILKKFPCTQCSRRFATRSHLKYHQKSHNSPSFSCSNCSKTFRQELLLQRHMRTHNSSGFPCQQCSRIFRSQGALTAHAVLHSGNSLPYKCVDCSKHYLTMANLRQHRVKHEPNSRRHQCNVCNKCFLRSSTLRLHQARHTQRPRHACSQCNKTYNDVDALQRHVKQHTAKLRYRCMECDVTVSRRDNMKRHMRSMHPGIEFDAGVQVLDVEQSTTTLPAAAEQPTAPSLRYSSVIMSVGNVQPVVVPELEPEQPLPEKSLPDKVQKENVKLYRKIILDLDNEEYSNELSTTGLDMDESTPTTAEQQATQLAPPQHPPLPDQSNSCFRHWRKNFKYFYENEHTN